MNHWTKIIVIFAAIGLLVFFNSQGWLQAPKSIFYKAFSPFQKISSDASRKTANFFGIFIRAKSLKEQNQKLQEENLRLVAESSKIASLERENDFLRKGLGLDGKKSFDFILADVIGSDIHNFDQFIFINKGLGDGVKTGQAAVISERILVGLVKEVYEKNSKIETIFSFSGRINVITEKSLIPGVLVSKNSGTFIDLIDPQKNIAAGEKVLTSGSAGIFPKGLLVGEIKEIINKDNQIFNQALISVPYSIKDLERVLIIKGFVPQ